MGGGENVHSLKKSDQLRSALLRRLGQRFAPILNILRDAFQTLAGQLRPGGNLLNIRKRLGVVHLFPEFLQEGMNLGENEKHFAANAGLKEEFFVDGAVQYQRCGHIPVAADLAHPGIFLTGECVSDFQDVGGALRPEFRRKPVYCLAHLRFPALKPSTPSRQNRACWGPRRGVKLGRPSGAGSRYSAERSTQAVTSRLHLPPRARNRILYSGTRLPIRLCGFVPPGTRVRNPDTSRGWASPRR